MKQNCPCGQPSPDAFLCKSCSLRLERALGDLPALIADLDITLTRQAVTGPQSDGKAADTPPPLHIGAAVVASDLRYTLATSIRYLTEARGITEAPTDNPPSMARWLLRYADSIRLDPAGPDIAGDIHGITHRIVTVIDLPRTRGRFKVGMCPEVDEKGAYCPGEIWAHLPAEGVNETARMECQYCHHVYETWQWHRAGVRILKRGAA